MDLPSLDDVKKSKERKDKKNEEGNSTKKQGMGTLKRRPKEKTPRHEDDLLELGEYLESEKSETEKSEKNLQKKKASTMFQLPIHENKEPTTENEEEIPSKGVDKDTLIEEQEQQPITISLTEVPLNSLKLRDKCAREIYDTEISYITSLTTLRDEWIKQLKDRKLITNDEAKELFSNVESILEFSRNQLAFSLKERMDVWNDNQKLGDVFNRLTPFLRLYKTYCDNYENALALLTRLSKKRKEIATFLKCAEEACKGFSCSYFLIMPVQRVPRYQLLLRELISKTSETHPDYEHLTKAMSLITTLAAEVNASVTKAEKARAMGDLMSMGNFVGLDEIIAPHRQMILHGPAHAKVSDGTVCKIILLFNDLCAFAAADTKKARKEKDQQIYIKEKIALNTAWITDLSDSDEWFKIKTPEIPNIFVERKVKDPKNKDHDWHAEIQKQIKSWLITASITKRPEEAAINDKLITDVVNNCNCDLRYTQYTFNKDKNTFLGHWLGGFPHGEGRLQTESGVVITGTWNKGQLDGQGKAVYPNGDTYEGQWHLQIPNGNGTLTYSNGTLYEGEWQNGMRCGQGTMTWPNGSKYIGQWEQNRMHGTGVLTGVINKEKCLEFTYEGEFEKDMRSGTGTLKTLDRTYTGDWKLNHPHGKGKETTSTSTYEGSWHEGTKDGEGSFVWKGKSADGSYVGRWQANLYHGEGTLTMGKYCYVGNWKQGVKSGEGKEVCPDKGTYSGGWLNSLYQGKGSWTHNGEKYSGTWQQGLRDGEGKYTYAGGNTYEGSWSLGIRKGKGTYTWKNLGCTYKGYWEADQPHGEGVLQSPSFSYEGKWIKGKRTGEGILKIDKDTFVGTFKNGKKEGFGEEKVGNTIIKGNWTDGKKNGEMQITDGTGKVTTTNYKDGVKQAMAGTFWQIPDFPEIPVLDLLRPDSSL